MVSSDEIWVINKLNALLERVGLDPSCSYFTLDYEPGDGKDKRSHYLLSFNPFPGERSGALQIQRFMNLSGSEPLEFSSLLDVNRAVDQALATAPRRHLFAR